MQDHQVARIDELETKLAFHEHAVDALNDVIVAHQQQLAQLQRQYDALIKRLTELDLDSLFEQQAGDEVPPHY